MGIKDFIRRLGGAEPSAAPSTELAPISRRELAPISGTSGAQMGFMSGSDGEGKSLTWSRYSVPYFTSGYGPWMGTPGAEISRERSVVAAVTTDMLASNSVVATLVEQFAVTAIGNGLTLSSKPLAAALGISPEAARELSHEIETKWALWANNPTECDASQRHDLHQLATASFKSWVLTGESVFLCDWKKGNGAQTATKIQLLDARQIDASITRVNEQGNALQGVQFDKLGRVVGYWIRPFVLGNFSSAPQPIFVRARTSWGRARAVHLFDLLTPGQVRGLSPIIAALTPAKSKETLQEFALASAFVQQMMAATIESDLPTRQALDQFKINDGLQGYNDATPSLAEWAKGRGEYYTGAPVRIEPGVISHLPQGDRLKLHRSETPNSTYDEFHKALVREAAKAGGASYEDLSGDYSKTSFSASRLALDMPNRISERRRRVIAVRFYQTAFENWLEEQIETRAIALPPGAPEFWQAKAAYCNSVWRGKGKANSDPLKAAQANVLLLKNGLATYEQVLGDDGSDFEEIVAQRKAEKEMLEAAGLPYPVPDEQAALIETSDDEDANDKALG